jgi:hypothetical protein
LEIRPHDPTKFAFDGYQSIPSFERLQHNFEVNQYSFLTQLGFQQTKKWNEVIYSSDKLAVKISLQRYGEPAAIRFYNAIRGGEVPSPIVALQFFLDDFESESEGLRGSITQPSALRTAIATNAELLKRNDWVVKDISWTQDKKFLDALREVGRWFLHRKAPMPSADEVVRKLRSLSRG